jgi:hypothetical protein
MNDGAASSLTSRPPLNMDECTFTPAVVVAF